MEEVRWERDESRRAASVGGDQGGEVEKRAVESRSGAKRGANGTAASNAHVEALQIATVLASLDQGPPTRHRIAITEADLLNGGLSARLQRDLDTLRAEVRRLESAVLELVERLEASRPKRRKAPRAKRGAA